MQAFHIQAFHIQTFHIQTWRRAQEPDAAMKFGNWWR
jgi:hypothetical protein